MLRRWRWLVLVLAVLAGVTFFQLARPVLHAAGVATEYVARRACLCVFVSGRPLPVCLVEMPGEVSQVEAEILSEERAVRARLSFVARRIARYDGGMGCTLE